MVNHEDQWIDVDPRTLDTSDRIKRGAQQKDVMNDMKKLVAELTSEMAAIRADLLAFKYTVNSDLMTLRFNMTTQTMSGQEYIAAAKEQSTSDHKAIEMKLEAVQCGLDKKVRALNDRINMLARQHCTFPTSVEGHGASEADAEAQRRAAWAEWKSRGR